MKSTKYILIPDTNVLNPNKYETFQYFGCKKELFDFTNDIRKLPQRKNLIKICFPEMVKEELIEHQNSKFEENLESINIKIEKIKSLAKSLTIPELVTLKGNIVLEQNKFNYKQYLMGKARHFFSKYDIEELKIPKIPTAKFIRKSLAKKSPFNKDSGDGGFKDAIIWESVLQYASQHKDENIIFWTKDKDYKKEVLEPEFKLVSEGDIYFFEEIADIKVYLDGELSLKENLEKAIEKLNLNDIERAINMNYSVVTTKYDPYHVLGIYLGHKLLDIKLEDKTKKRYKLTFPIRIIYTDYAEEDCQSKIADAYDTFESYGVLEESIYEDRGIATVSITDNKTIKIEKVEIANQDIEIKL